MRNIINLIFNIDPFIFVQPDGKLSSLNKKNVIANIYFFTKNFNLKQTIKYFFYLVRLLFLDFAKIIYSPLIFFIYLSKYRFLRLSSNQIGVLAHHLDAMIKLLLLKNKKPIIMIPAYSEYSSIFTHLLSKKFLYFNNSFLNIFCLPLIYSEKISVAPEFVETFFDKNKIINKNFYNKILSDYEEKFKNSFELFEFDKNRKTFLNKIVSLQFKNLDLKKTYILHTRDKKFYNTSNLRTSNFEDYIEAIEYLLKNNYSVIRIIHSKQKSNFRKKNYYEFDFNSSKYKDLQIYLIKESRGVICNHGGLSSVAALLGVPICQTNAIPFDHCHGNKNTDLILHKKLKKNNVELNLNYILNSNLKYALKSDLESNFIEIEDNSKFEILDAVKLFNSKLQGNQIKVETAKNIFKNKDKKLSINYANSYIYKN